jgi:hypothetical protein
MEHVYLFYSHFGIFKAIWSIVTHFGMFQQENLATPALSTKITPFWADNGNGRI